MGGFLATSALNLDRGYLFEIFNSGTDFGLVCDRKEESRL
jgi:hypothetical protein